MGKEYLGEFEELVLTMVAVLQEDAYGAAISDEIEQRLKREVNLSAVHVTLYRLEDKGLIKSFHAYDEAYRQEHDIDLNDRFDISEQAVKKQARVFKSVLKLDKNFHIYIHGDKQLIEHGVEKDGRKFYKIYYKVESWVQIDNRQLAVGKN